MSTLPVLTSVVAVLADISNFLRVIVWKGRRALFCMSFIR